MKLIKKEFDGLFTALDAALNGAGQNLIDAGKIIVKMLTLEEDAFEMILARRQGVTLAFLEALEKIGRGTLDPYLLTAQTPAAARVLSSGIPIEIQKRAINVGVPVAVKDNGGYRTETKRVSEMNQQEARRTFGNGRLRTPEEQTNMITREEFERKQRDGRYIIEGERVTFRKDTVFTWTQLSELCEKIKPKAVDIESEIKRKQIAK